jgi:hypothetical protein
MLAVAIDVIPWVDTGHLMEESGRVRREPLVCAGQRGQRARIPARLNRTDLPLRAGHWLPPCGDLTTERFRAASPARPYEKIDRRSRELRTPGY